VTSPAHKVHVSVLSHADYVANIVAYWDSATPEQREAGARWYPTAYRLAALIAEETKTDIKRVVTVMAALSPRNPWRWNVADTFAYCEARAEGRTCPKANTFKRNQAAAWRALDPSVVDPWLTAAPKVRNFVEAICGDSNAVVVDTWAVRVATGHRVNEVRTPKAYWTVAHAYNVAANLRGVPPAVMQATTWLVARTEGTALLRAETFKAGTPEFLRVALSA
jgi:hypothetical protein